jgi:outer membrane protein TolC
MQNDIENLERTSEVMKYMHGAKVWMLVTVVLPAAVAAQEPTQLAQEAQLESYVVGTALPPVDVGRELVEMNLDGAIQRAMEFNLDIQTVSLNPRMQAFALQAARAAFNPTISGSYGYSNSTRQSTSQLDGGARTNTERMTFNTSLSQTVPWYGGRLSADFNNSRAETNNSFTTLNPSYSSSVSLNYTQPLLSGRRTDNQRAALQTQQIQGQIADIQVTAQIANIVDQVRVRYWNLRASIEQIEIQRRALARAEEQLAQNQLRVQLGSMAQIQIIQAQSQVAAAEQSLLNAEVQWRNAELGLKSVLISGASDPLLSQTINPVELPTLREQAVDIQAALEIALRERTDLRQQRNQLEMSAIDLEVTDDARLPDLNLTASYSLSGVGGNEFNRDQLGGAPVLIQEGGYFDGLNSIAGFDTPTWNMSMNFSYPIGMRGAKANSERAKLQVQQSQIAIRAQELAVVTQVTDAGLSVNDTRLQLAAAERSRELAEQNAIATVTRFNAGVATNFEVGQANDDLTSSRLSELRALINHINAIAEFERVQRIG